jgi:hypothetical protein
MSLSADSKAGSCLLLFAAFGVAVHQLHRFSR